MAARRSDDATSTNRMKVEKRVIQSETPDALTPRLTVPRCTTPVRRHEKHKQRVFFSAFVEVGKCVLCVIVPPVVEVIRHESMRCGGELVGWS